MVPITLLDLIENNGYLKSLTDIYKLNGYDFYLVGGAVRDGILDIPTNDFDFMHLRPRILHRTGVIQSINK